MEKTKIKEQNQMYQNNNPKYSQNGYNPPINNARPNVYPEYDVNQYNQRKNIPNHWVPPQQKPQEQIQYDEQENYPPYQNYVAPNQTEQQNYTEDQEKKTKDIGYIYIPDKETKNRLNNLAKPLLTDGTNFIFWYSKTNPNSWGLTIKNVSEYDDERFSSQHTWKATWFHKDGALLAAKHCKSIAQDIYDNEDEKTDNYTQILNIFKSYTKHRNKSKKPKNKFNN